MPKGLIALPSLALAAFLSLPSAVQAAPDADTVVARINGEEITLGHVIIARATLPQQYQQIAPDVLLDAIIDQLIQQTALKQSRTGDVPKHVELSLENERRSLLAAEVIEQVMIGAATEEAIQAAYDKKYGDGFGDDEYNAAHILVETEDEAKAIRAELESGADFAETAKARSTGPSGPNGGDLGWFQAGAMVPEFEAVVLTLEPGQISDPVQTQFGWHIVTLNEKRKSAAPAIADVSAELASELQTAAVEDKVEELTAAATVERPEVEGLTPDMIENIDLLND